MLAQHAHHHRLPSDLFTVVSVLLQKCSVPIVLAQVTMLRAVYQRWHEAVKQRCASLT